MKNRIWIQSGSSERMVIPRPLTPLDPLRDATAFPSKHNILCNKKTPGIFHPSVAFKKVASKMLLYVTHEKVLFDEQGKYVGKQRVHPFESVSMKRCQYERRTPTV